MLLGGYRTVSGFLEAAHDLVRGHLRVGAVGPYPLMKFLKQYREKFPDVSVSVDLGNSDDVLQGLRDQRTDVGIVSQIKANPDIVITPFGRQNVVVFVSVNHPWSDRTSISLEDLNGQDMVMREEGSMTRRAFEKVLNERKVRPSRCTSIAGASAFLTSGYEWFGLGREFGDRAE